MTQDPYAPYLLQAQTLFSQGEVVKAGQIWQAILKQQPTHAIAREGLMAVKRHLDALQALASPPQMPMLTEPTPTEDPLDVKLGQAEHLLSLQRYDEAAHSFRQALLLDPHHERALAGLAQCAPTPTPSAEPRVMTEAPVMRIRREEEEAITPPARLLVATPISREGLALPAPMTRPARWLPRLTNPRTLRWVLGTVAVVALLGFLNSLWRDRALKAAVRAARDSAAAPAVHQAQAAELTETPAAIRKEAEDCLGSDPLRAYLRARTLVALDPADSAAAQQLEKAKAGLALKEPPPDPDTYAQALKAGDLEGAAKVMDALLRAAPEDADLRAQAARLHLARCAAHAANGKWDAAREDLARGRALYPGQKIWLGRLYLLDRIKALPKAEQPAWIPLLG